MNINPEIQNSKLKVKICGMKYPSNIKDITALKPDFIGFIFYAKSPRYVEPFPVEVLDYIPETIKKTGVIVNSELDEILLATYKYKLNAVQLHGIETEEICAKLHETGLTVIKAFSIEMAGNFFATKRYEGLCDYFLFDTKTPAHGGSGVKFDWNLLNEYKGNTPFLLSGGITNEDIEAIKAIKHPLFAGVDLNSRFEIKPGLKDVLKLKQFINELRWTEKHL